MDNIINEQSVELALECEQNDPRGVCAVYKAPVEILSNIFNHVVFSEDSISALTPPHAVINTTSYHSRSSPFAISHVCRQWRSIVLDTPELWTKFSIIEPGFYLIHLILTWLYRSGTKPLEFGLHQGGDKVGFSTTLAIFNLLLGHSGRWKSVIIDVDSRVELLLDIGTLPPPIELEEVHVILRRGATVDRCPKLSYFLHSSPRLHTMSWDNRRVALPLPAADWGNLTNITLYATQSIQHLLDSLQHCNVLETLTIHRQSKIHHFNVDLPDVVLPNLRELYIGAFPQLNAFFNSLTLPALTDLTFSKGLEETDLVITWTVVHDLIARSSCTLRSLCLADINSKYEKVHVRNLKAPNFSSLDSLLLIFQRTYAKIQFGEFDGCGSNIVVRNFDDEPQWPKIDILVPKAPGGKIKPSDIGCATRYAFAFDAEFNAT